MLFLVISTELVMVVGSGVIVSVTGDKVTVCSVVTSIDETTVEPGSLTVSVTGSRVTV